MIGYEEWNLVNNMNCKICNVSLKLHKQFCFKCEQEICEEYLSTRKSLKQVGLKYNISDKAVMNILRRNNVKLRTISEALKGKYIGWHRTDIVKLVGFKGKTHTEESKKKMSEANSGSNNGNWKGGVSFEPYCPKFNDEFKERCREFWSRKCVMSGISEKENGQRLSVHHVTYDKKTCCNDALPLFVPVSKKWNSKFNTNRKYWHEMLTNYIMIYFDGQCYLEKGGNLFNDLLAKPIVKIEEVKL